MIKPKEKAAYKKEWARKNKEKIAAANKRHRQKYKLRYKKQNRAWYLLHNYGITPDDFNKMFKEQQGCCAICGTHEIELNHRLNVDHNHNTNEVRGLLCNQCNQALGLLKVDTNIDNLKLAIQYLKGGD